MVKVNHCSDELVSKMLSWCCNSFELGGTNKDWLFETDTNTFIFWEEAYYGLFMMRWTGQSD